MSDAITISLETARHFILGKQGLWPGRRWKGMSGTEKAMRAIQHVQLDPLVVIARSQDITLHSRVEGYKPDDWTTLTYTQRKFFDWGGWLAVRPMEELPHWRAVMRHESKYPHWDEFAKQHAAAIDEMRQTLRERDMVSNRDFAMHTRTRTNSYRGRKDSAVALYYLWRMGEAMVHHRERFERVYALTEKVAPAHLITHTSPEEADDFMLRKDIAFYGLRAQRFATGLAHHRATDGSDKPWLDKNLESGELIRVNVEGWKNPQYALAADAPLLADLIAGRVPKAWKPIGPTTEQEATLLAPLDVVSARGRAKPLFNFDYKWEVYTPESQRKFGYYALPILWKDALVARMDLKFDRPQNTLVVKGLWFEETATSRNADFARALAVALARFLGFLGAQHLDVKAVKPAAFRAMLKNGAG
jgi:uncharacterized protein YcaQ